VSDNSLDQQGGAEGDTYTEYQYHKHCMLATRAMMGVDIP